MMVLCLTLSAKITAKEITNGHHVLGIRIISVCKLNETHGFYSSKWQVYSNSEFYQSVNLFYRGSTSRTNFCQRRLQNVDLRCLNIN